MWVFVFVFIIARIFLSISHPIGVTVNQAEFALKPVYQTSLISSVATQAWFSAFGTGELQFRILGDLVYVLLVVCLYLRLKDNFSESYTWTLLFFIAINPWVNILTLQHIPEAFTVLFLCLSTLGRFRPIYRFVFWILLVCSSVPGLVGGIIISGQFWRKNKLLFFSALLIWCGLLFFARTQLRSLLTGSMLSRYQSTQLTTAINNDIKDIYLGANKRVVPAVIRSVAYNKIVYSLDYLSSSVLLALDPTGWTAPAGGYDLTQLSGYPPKGVTAIFQYWEIPLVILGVLAAGWVMPLFVLAAIGPIAMSTGFRFGQFGIFLLPVLLFYFLRGYTFIAKRSRLLTVVILVAAVWGSGQWLRSVYFYPETYLDAHSYAYRKLYDLYNTTKSHTSTMTITNRLGPTQLMFDFYSNNSIPTSVLFDSFDLSRTNPESGRMYIGFEKEFGDTVHSATTVAETRLVDEVVHLYGTNLWAVKY